MNLRPDYDSAPADLTLGQLHLLVTVFLTTDPLPNAGATNSGTNRVEQFLAALESWTKIQYHSAEFYVTLSPEYAKFAGLVYGRIRETFPHSVIDENRLASFEDWRRVSENLPTGTTHVLLLSNHDHAYIPATDAPLKSLIASMGRAGIEKAYVSHWPEAIVGSRLESRALVDKGFATRKACVATGTELVSANLFRSWWREDFTGGAPIVRPDNPFGPYVEFEPLVEAVPPIELFRHMDGYNNVAISRWPANEIHPNVSVTNGELTRRSWAFSSNYFQKAEIFQVRGLEKDSPRDIFGLGLGIFALSSSCSWRPATASRVLKFHGFSLGQRCLVLLAGAFLAITWERIHWELKFHLKWRWRQLRGLPINQSVYK